MTDTLWKPSHQDVFKFGMAVMHEAWQTGGSMSFLSIPAIRRRVEFTRDEFNRFMDWAATTGMVALQGSGNPVDYPGDDGTDGFTDHCGEYHRVMSWRGGNQQKEERNIHV